VLIGHVRQFILVGYDNVEHKDIFIKGFYFITGLGPEGVVVFFVISGLLVGGSTLRKWSIKVSYRDYFTARVSRIYTTLLPGLLFGGVLDWYGSYYFNASEIYTKSLSLPLNLVIIDHLNLTTFIGNLLNLQGFLVHTFGSNIPLWNLAYEWWYYTIFALVLACIYGEGLISKILAFVVLSMLVVFLPAMLILWIVIWLLGVGVYLYGESSLPKPSTSLSLILFIAALILSRVSHNIETHMLSSWSFIEFGRDFCFGAVFSYFLLSFYQTNFIFPMEKISKFLANFSFSMYAIQMPILIMLIALLNDTFGIKYMRQPDIKGMMYFCVVVILIYIISYLFSRGTEKHSHAIRTMINLKIERISSRLV
jgi:peptidoglycan/LPS O-acetylase OafA/YrhL